MLSDHSTKKKAHRKSGPQGARQEQERETGPGICLSARASEKERALEKLDTNRGTWLTVRARVREPEWRQAKLTALKWLNIIGRAWEQVTLVQEKPEQTQTSTRWEIKATGQTWADTRRKCTPAQWEDPEDPEVLVANRI